MKTTKNITRYLFALCLITTACSDDSYHGIDNSGEVKILSFSATGSKLNVLQEDNDYIELILPSSADLTAVTPSFTLSQGAHLASPEKPEGPIDLSKVVTYRVINKNLYHDYRVIAKRVADVTYFTEFTINDYKGSIDNKARKITVKMPVDTDVTVLSPKFALSDGAKLIYPATTVLDFTQPQNYTIEYLEETFTYAVEVQLVNFIPVAFIGDPETAADISNADDKAAYEWLASNFPEQEYVSFADIRGGKDLSKFGVIWFHCDPDRFDIPTSATSTKVTTALNDYYLAGGSLLLTSAGVKLGTFLEIAKDKRMWNNDWGYGNDPSILGENWGMSFKGNESHPIFQGLRMEAGETHRFYLLGQGVGIKGHNAIWNFDTWTGYNFDVQRWQDENGSKQLASFYWDDAMNQRSIITEYERNGSKGGVITIAVESYDWYHENNSPANPYRDNLERLTENILNYLAE